MDIYTLHVISAVCYWVGFLSVFFNERMYKPKYQTLGVIISIVIGVAGLIGCMYCTDMAKR